MWVSDLGREGFPSQGALSPQRPVLRPGFTMEVGRGGAALPGPGVPAPNGQHFPTEGGSRGLIWDPRCPRPGGLGARPVGAWPGKEKPTWRERSALLGMPSRLHSLRPVPSRWSLTVLGGVLFQAAQNAQGGGGSLWRSHS